MATTRLTHVIVLIAAAAVVVTPAVHAQQDQHVVLNDDEASKVAHQYGNFSFDPVSEELGTIWIGFSKSVRITFPDCDANYTHYEAYVDDLWVGLIDNVTLLGVDENGGCHGLIVVVQGSNLGRAHVRVKVSYPRTDSDDVCAGDVVKEAEYEVVVVRHPKVEQQVFRLGVAGFLVILNFGFGCSLDLEVVKEILRRPFAPALGFCCQYVMMPLVRGLD